MFSSLSRAAADRPRGALAAVVVAAVALGVLAAGAPGRVGVAGLSASGSESDRASSVVRAALGHDAEPDLVLVTRGAVRVRAPAYGVALRTIATQLRGDPAVAAVQRGPIGRDGRSTAVAVFLRGEAPARERAVGRIQRNLDPGPLRVLYGGRVAVLRSARDHVRHEIGRL